MTGEDLEYKPSMIECSPLGMTMNKAIKSANNARKPVKYDSGLRYYSYIFVEFKRDAEKLKKKHHHLIKKIMR